MKHGDATRILSGHKKATTNAEHPVYGEYRDIARFWMLTLLVPMGAHKMILVDQVCREDEVMDELGLSHLVQVDKYNATESRKALYDLYAEAVIAAPPTIKVNTKLAKNIDWLSRMVGLNEVEKVILHFRIIASRHLALRNCITNLGNGFDHLYITCLLANLLGLSQVHIEKALNPDSKLVRTGLIGFSEGLGTMIDKMNLLPGMADKLFMAHEDCNQIFQNNYVHVSPAQLTAADYPHLKEDIFLISHYLKESLEGKRSGVNILIYGTPGSGKTELSK